MTPKVTIGRLAKQAGVNIDTVRYYERRGLLTPDGFLESGYRLYDPEAVRKLRFIRNAQELGFTLNEISGLLKLRVGKGVRCSSVKKKAQSKLESVDEKIARLQAIRGVLKDLIGVCHSGKATEHCPILRTMEQGVRRS